jgi:hypothetical protein
MCEPEKYRCYDDQCRQRTTCRWWRDRDTGQGHIAMTWRRGYEDAQAPCSRWARAEIVERCVTYE